MASELATASESKHRIPRARTVPHFTPEQVEAIVSNEGTLARVREAFARGLRISSMEHLVEKKELKDLGQDTWRCEQYVAEEARYQRTIREYTARVVLKMQQAIASLGKIDKAVRFDYCITIEAYNQSPDSAKWIIQMNKYGHATTVAKSRNDEVMLE